MQYHVAANNPFGVLTAIVAPAILTNACSVLALGTGNRLARVADRTRVVASKIAESEPGSPDLAEWSSQLGALERRTRMLVPALRLIYAALGLFASTALISAAGSIADFYGQKLVFELGAVLAITAGTCAVVGLFVGCYFMVNETRLAMRSLADEARMSIRTHEGSKPG